MNATREVLFNLLLNACVQIALFAIVAAGFSRFVFKAKAKHQHLFYLGAMVLCLAMPSINTIWHVRTSALAGQLSQDVLHEPQSSDQNFWNWAGHSKAPHVLSPGSRMEEAILALWAAVVLYQAIHFGRGLHRVHRIRKDGRPLSPAEIGAARWIMDSQRIDFLASTDVAHPVTVGVIRPVVILPNRLIPALGQHEFATIFAHECAHIRRGDYAIHIACEVLSLPFALHPGIRYLMSKISQTRELACDEVAAIQLGERRLYARTLLRLATLCLQASPGSVVGLGIFDGDNLEDRIMMLTKKRKPLSRASLLGLVFAIGVTFGSGAVVARATSRQTTGSPEAAQSFAGTWHWMFQGKSFATMKLIPSGSGFTGSVTESRIALNDNGGLMKADASDDTMPKQIAKAELEGSTLRVKVADGFEFTMALKDDTHAEIIPSGAPANMKPIPLEKAR